MGSDSLIAYLLGLFVVCLTAALGALRDGVSVTGHLKATQCQALGSMPPVSFR